MTALLAGLALVAAACGNGDSEDAGAGEGGGLSGEIVISGSSTVEPISSAVGKAFSDGNPGASVSVDGPGTGDGFQLFCEGSTDISDASRAIKDEEAQACADAGIEFIELKVGIDGIAVLTSPEGEGVADCLDFPALYALVGPESTGFARWSDAAPLAEEAGSAFADRFPDAPLDITAPGEESGTYDSFVELALEDLAEERGQEAQTRPDYQSSGDDNVIVQGIEGSSSSFGWVGFAFFEANREALKAFEVDGGDGCVEPTPDTIASGEYPLSRPLFIYVNAQRLADNPTLASFVELYLNEGITKVSEVGYVQLEEGELAETRTAFENREAGTREG
ncbi:MAG: substrate-binding domain-containing protein [Acidimicrobiales bacterium]